MASPRAATQRRLRPSERRRLRQSVAQARWAAASCSHDLTLLLPHQVSSASKGADSLTIFFRDVISLRLSFGGPLNMCRIIGVDGSKVL